ncbi:MAG TPA: UTP--glucose-1-phosphate uridylyltransferase GalU [Blastocatellia bacterium]|nr:UTP--glucose-1-phosphate uridylyltransferase GalU [Blastocatellia bacterium]
MSSDRELKPIRKAVFPVAGLGTRFLPATKVIPKEMLTLVDKPLIQYGVEEALASGIEQIIFVNSHGKTAIEDHFDISPELEQQLEARGKKELLDLAKKVGRMANVATVRQKEALGLGHAVLQAKNLVGDEPFAVLLPDDIIAAETPCIAQMMEAYKEYRCSIVAVMEVERSAISKYGSIAVSEQHGRAYKIMDMVEKPPADKAPSNLAIIGRYILMPEIFRLLETTKRGSGGEIQVTDAMKDLLKEQSFYGYNFEGKRYDAGDKLGFLEATVEFGMKHPDLGAAFTNYLKHLKIEN